MYFEMSAKLCTQGSKLPRLQSNVLINLFVSLNLLRKRSHFF